MDYIKAALLMVGSIAAIALGGWLMYITNGYIMIVLFGAVFFRLCLGIVRGDL